jgi:Zn-dependent M16 (insulinase) family peptidase
VEKAKYELGVKWLREILYQTKFPAERLKVIAKRMNNDISKYKRKGNAVLKAVFRSLVFSQGRSLVFLRIYFFNQLIRAIDFWHP